MFNAGPIGKRRNSVSGELQDVFEYRISSQQDFEGFARSKSRRPSSYDVHRFNAQHIAMEPASKDHNNEPDQNPGSTAYIRPMHKHNYITNAVSGCSIVRMDSDLSHWWPYKEVDNNYSNGEELEDAIKRTYPDAHVFGPRSYDKRGTNLFIKSSRRGSVHIFGQRPDQGRDTENWSANVQEAYFPPVELKPGRVRRTAEFYQKNVEAARKGLEFEAALNRRIQSARPFVPDTRSTSTEVQDHEWD